MKLKISDKVIYGNPDRSKPLEIIFISDKPGAGNSIIYTIGYGNTIISWYHIYDVHWIVL